jgi:predicted MFS family arabinose efflux permease
VAFGTLGVWWGAWGVLLPAVQRSAEVDDGRLGTALLFIGLGALASMGFTGRLIDRPGLPSGRSRLAGNAVLPLSVAALGVAGVGPALVVGVVALSGSSALIGAASGAYDVAINAEGSRVEEATQRPLLNLAHAWFSFGVIGGSLGAGAMRTTGVGLTSALVTFGVALVAVGGWLAAGAASPAKTSASGADPAVAGEGPWRWWSPPRDLAILGGLLALAFLVESAWQTWSAVHLERDLGASPAIASVGPALFGGSSGLGRVLAHRRTVTGREGRVVATGAAVAAVGTLVAATIPSTALVLAAIAVAGLGTAGCAPSLFSLAGRAAPARARGAAMGTVTTIGYLGFVLAPAIVGGLAEATTLPTALAFVTVAAAALAVGASRLP